MESGLTIETCSELKQNTAWCISQIWFSHSLCSFSVLRCLLFS